MIKKVALLVIATGIIGSGVKAQHTTVGQELNAITTAVPFLTISPDSRASGMGDLGVATNPDANSMHWNPAKYAFLEKNFGGSVSYTPWLRKLVDDINLGYLNAYKRLDENQTVALSLLYFNLGSIQFTNEQGDNLKVFNPQEFSLDAAYSRKFSKNISGGLAFRYIHSNLSDNATNGAGNAYAMDVSTYYQDYINRTTLLGIGLNISNVGSKIKYSDDNKNFIPINLRLGTAVTMEIDKYNSIMVGLDLNKLLVPTPPIDSATTTGTVVIIDGKNQNVSVPVGMLQSFYDAPGGFNEEMREISFSIGAEYWYAKQFAARAGYFYEDKTKGNRKYFTFGLGLRYNVFGLDFAYLVSATNQATNPLAETMRFTFIFDLDAVQ